ncbi:lycopene cyclase domain-containing protein [Hamadaea tsunoensis]|uniref:lycopene cyclase domain-containing protein n=1 Tax=Hamadaea tsunoensis TaxID=53368 RepID=UPI00040093EC|nr:lycopene cyclase domain-containing protein [Hamadaea tsunoensis]
MDRWNYLAVLAACVVITLPLEVVLGARVYRRPRRLAWALLPVLAVFTGWDLVAAWRGHWWWSAQQTTGVRLAGLPVEEWLFFLIVPICALLTYEVLDRGR